MKILYVTASPVPSLAANSVHVVKMAQAIKNLGYDTTLLSPVYKNNTDSNHGYSLYEVYGVPGNFTHKKISVPSVKGGMLFHAFRTALYAKVSRTDVVFSRCLICAWVCTLFGVKTIFERHDVVNQQSPKVQKIFDKLLKSPNLLKIILISQALKNHFINNYNVDKDLFVVCPDGADPIADNILPIENLNGDKRPLAGYIGHLYTGRGIDIIVEMAQKMKNVDFLIIGGKPDDVEYWTENTKNVENIKFHGHIPHSQTTSYLLSFDFLLAPYQEKVIVSGGENTAKWMSPLKIFEYMSAGKPILCSDLPVLKEVLEDRKNSMLCTPDDSDDWCSKLGYLIDDKDFSKNIGAAALNDFSTKYTWKQRAAMILNSATSN